MQFKNPDILYALFLLLIPIIVHLFQLRKFKKTAFTNVAFLQSIVKNTRKSSQLKKWLILATRLLALTAAVLAFAQPYFPNNATATRAREKVIFLDNSFSMQAKGDKGPLLTAAVQELIASGEDFTLVTFDNVYKNINPVTDQNKLLELTYTSKNLEPEALNLQLVNSFGKDPSVIKELVVISDFQSVDANALDSLNAIDQYWVKLKPIAANNKYLDSLKISRAEGDYLLDLTVKQSGSGTQNVPVSLFNDDKLIAKATAAFDKTNTDQVRFRIPATAQFLGKITITDAALSYDNNFYFSINTPEPLNILSINNAPDDYLVKLYPTPEFSFTSINAANLSYDEIGRQEVIILNELETIPQSLVTILTDFSENAGQILFIPSIKTKASAYDNLLRSFGLPYFGEKNKTKKMVTSINYDHPLYKDVFERRAANFQYPSTSESFRLNGNSSILTLEDGAPFLIQGKNIFVFSASLNASNSNFQDSPLIVPTFQEMAKTALSLPKSFYFLNKNSNFDLKSENTGDAAYTLRKDARTFIPMQEKKGNIVTISTQEGIDQDGIYEIVFNDTLVGHVAYNYDRSETRSTLNNLKSGKNIPVFDSVSEALNKVEQAASLNLLYKWFVIFTVFFLLCEMLILKFLK